MTDSNDVLDRLDSRAARARAEIDRTLADVEAPAWPEPSGRRRPTARLLVAAAVIIVAVGGLVILGPEDREPTVAGPGGITLLWLPDPAAHGYELITAYDETATPPGPDHASRLGPDVVIHGPADVEDPWGAVVLDAVIGDTADPEGESIALGETTGVFTDGPVGGTLAWDTADGFRHLTSSILGRDELVAVAEAVIEQDVAVGDALPGHEVLYRGPISDLFPVALLADDPIPGTAALGYAPPDDPEAGFAVHLARGSAARWRAASALADTTQRVTVRGNDAVLATTGNRARPDEIVTELSWLESDGTLVRISWLGDRDLTAIADALDPVSTQEFATLVDDHVPSNQSTTTIEAEATPVTSIGMTDGPTHLYLYLQEPPDGGFAIEFTATTANSITGTGVELDDFDTNVALALPEHRAVAGLLGPALESVEFFDSTTGAPIEVIDSMIHHSEHSTHGMFIAVLDVDWGTAPSPPVEIVGTLEDGTEVRTTTER